MSSSKPTGDVKNADLELAGKIRSGDGAAFEELYQRHAGRLYNLAYRMAGTANDAEDLLQDIFLLAYRKIGSFRGDSSLGTWLYRLAMNHCLDVLRSRQARMGHQTDSLDEDAAPVPAAFLLHDVEGFGHQEVGAILGISEGTSKSQVHKARLRIRAYLTQPRVVEESRQV